MKTTENCEQKGQLPVTKADIDSLSDNIHSLNTQIQQELSEIRNDIYQLKQNSCEAKIEQLQNEIKDLKSSVGSLKQNSQPKPQYNQQSENHMSDKLIIFGIQENQDQISRIEAMNTDKKQVVSIFEQIMGLKDVVIHDCFRLGKLVNEKNRPVVVKIDNAWTFRTIFLSVSKLKGSGFVIKKFLSVEDYKKEKTLYQRKTNLINNFGYEKHSFSIKGQELFYKGKVIAENFNPNSMQSSTDQNVHTS